MQTSFLIPHSLKLKNYEYTNISTVESPLLKMFQNLFVRRFMVHTYVVKSVCTYKYICMYVYRF